MVGDVSNVCIRIHAGIASLDAGGGEIASGVCGRRKVGEWMVEREGKPLLPLKFTPGTSLISPPATKPKCLQSAYICQLLQPRPKH